MSDKIETKKNEKKASSRVRKLDYKSKKKSVKINEPIPSSFVILKSAISHVWRNKKLFAGIIFVYAILYLLLVKGLAANFQLPDTKEAIEEAGGDVDPITLGTVLFGSLVGTASSTQSESSAVYQVFLFILISLVLIWALRQTYEGSPKIKVKQAFYSGMYPLIQYILVWLLIILQLIPALIGVSVYSIVSSNGIAVGPIENILWAALALLLVSVSVFFVSSSLFATYIVALPKMTPMLAIRKASLIVKFRRFSVIRKVIFFPIVVLILSLVIFLPLVIYLTLLAEVLFVVFLFVLILMGHAYFYNLYRKLI